MFIDVHCHLEMFKDINGLVKESLLNQTQKMISSSVDFNSMKKNIEFSKKFDEIECCLGLHPSNILLMKEKEIDLSIDFLKKNIHCAVALGEIGIDFKHAKTTEQKEKQIKLYKKQLEIAEKNVLPVVTHSRFAEKKSLELLSDFKGKVLLHWFDGNKKTILDAIRKKYFFSVGPAVIYNPDYLAKAISIPLNLLMLETDSPVEFNGETAKPFWVKKVAEKLAKEKGISLKEIEEQTTKNAEEFFSI
ncbi:MAG: hypothetical protein COT90_02635 [Candidatus Diapherotrites archaeon CG10_big_fil_rev_8_21_14_0_10_31_34]|nr:MAG: hypothetical protein COT90_02635 [Candidatus Diapherotrites archaeon CG10_big_fil_rev_8_21_14_0_10_31_34]PJA21105.1 MAG: hypothetical protein COX63_00420 [Candidatus Diapherotrites archaeon CG_4_10_14_0_2_um_filter_31_5]